MVYICTYFYQVHFQRSVKNVSEKVNRSHSLAHQAFTTIGYAILHAKSEEDVLSLFHVLEGEEPLSTAICIVPQSTTLKEYQQFHQQEKWRACSNWAKWWMRPAHLSELLLIYFTCNCTQKKHTIENSMVCFLHIYMYMYTV